MLIAIAETENLGMATQQLLIRLSDAVVRRLTCRVPPRARSAFIQRLLEQALPADECEDDPLYQVLTPIEMSPKVPTENSPLRCVSGPSQACHGARSRQGTRAFRAPLRGFIP